MPELDLEMLRSYRTTVLTELADIDTRIERVREERLKKLEELEAIEKLLEVRDPEFVANPPAPGRTRRVTRNGPPVPDMAYEVLAERGEPTHYTDLYDAMCLKGMSVPGQNPAANLLAQMSHDQRFVRRGRGVWGLAIWPSPEPANGAVEVSNEFPAEE